MQPAEYADQDGVGLARLIASGEVSARDVLGTALACCRAVDAELNIVAHDLSDFAAAAVRRGIGEGPFAGVPFMTKDLSLDMAGVPSEGGSRLLAGYVAERDHNLMTRFARAGLVTIARSATAEFGASLATETALNGVTRNPWNRDHTPGGSSGGSAAAVAAGVVPVAHANDGIGSIRIPASNCGLFGLKLTRQRTPSGPDFGETIGGRGSEFIVSRSVRDAAQMLDCVHGADIGAPCWAPPPARPYGDELRGVGRPLRIALMTRSFSGAAIHADCDAAVRDAAAACAALGHHVEEAAPDFDWDAYRWAIRTEALANFAAGMDHFAARTQRRLADTLEPLNLLAVEEGRRTSVGDYLKSVAIYGATQRAMGGFFESFDLLLTPTLAQPPAAIGALGADPADFETYWQEFAGDLYSPFTGVFNVTGHPAASIPLFTNAAGLPIGSQFVGRFGDEGTILALAADLERARPWRSRRPPIHVSTLIQERIS